ncbi:hypothetical protein LINPERHAP1_LOCUS21213 [Linum perenne]
MQTSTLPAQILKDIDSRIRNFVWGSSKTKGKFILFLGMLFACLNLKEDSGLGRLRSSTRHS